MRTIKDVLKLIAPHIEGDKVEALTAAVTASDLNAVEFEDEDFEKIKGGFDSLMTVDAALANSEVVDKVFEENKSRIMNQSLFAVEKRLKGIGKKIGVDLSDNIKWGEALDQLEGKIEATAGGRDEDTVKLITSLKEDKETLSKQLAQKETDFEAKLKEKESEFEGMNVRRDFNHSAKSFNWADPYRDDEVNKALIDSMYSKISKDVVLKIVDGELVPFQKENPEKEYYIGNKKATFQDLVGPLVEPYLKKNDPSPKPGGDKPTPENGELSNAAKRVEAMKQIHGV